MTNGSETVLGRIPVAEALRARRRRPHRLYVLRSAHDLDEIRALAGEVPVEEVGRQDLDRLANGATHQGVVLQAAALPLLDIKEWLHRLQGPDATLVVLDSIEDPHNFGAIVRSAAACGAHGVLFAKDRSAPLSPATAKAAAGALEHIDLVRVTNIARALEALKKAEFWTATLDADAPKAIWEADLLGRIALVVGNEGAGVRRLVREQCDWQLSIPLQGPITSLNASVSAGIALAECARQRWQKRP